MKHKDFTKKIEKFAKENKIPVLGKIPYDKKFVKSLVNLKPAIEYDKSFGPLFTETLNNILNKLDKN